MIAVADDQHGYVRQPVEFGQRDEVLPANTANNSAKMPSPVLA
jgi:hypothetical protein